MLPRTGACTSGPPRTTDNVALRPAIVNWRTTERDVDELADVVLELRARLPRDA